MRMIFLLAVLFVLAACGRGAGDYPETENTTVLAETAEVTETPELPEPLPYSTTIHVSDEISITMYRLQDGENPDFFERHETFFELAEYGSERGGIAIVANYPLRNFRYLRISGAVIEFIVESDLFSLDELPPETPLGVDWVPQFVFYERWGNVGLDLFADIYENYIILERGGRFGIERDSIYAIDEDGNLVELDGVYSWERSSGNCACCNMYPIAIVNRNSDHKI